MGVGWGAVCRNSRRDGPLSLFRGKKYVNRVQKFVHHLVTYEYTRVITPTTSGQKPFMYILDHHAESCFLFILFTFINVPKAHFGYVIIVISCRVNCMNLWHYCLSVCIIMHSATLFSLAELFYWTILSFLPGSLNGNSQTIHHHFGILSYQSKIKA